MATGTQEYKAALTLKRTPKPKKNNGTHLINRLEEISNRTMREMYAEKAFFRIQHPSNDLKPFTNEKKGTETHGGYL